MYQCLLSWCLHKYMGIYMGGLILGAIRQRAVNVAQMLNVVLAISVESQCKKINETA